MYHVIVNPTAGGGRAQNAAVFAEKSFAEHGFPYKMYFTEYPGHATELAKNIVEEGGETILSVGGDGTLQEVVNAIARTNVTLGIIPAGTGNDFMRMLNISGELEKALKTIYRGTTVKTDLGLINDKRYFLNAIGTGIDVDVVRWSRRFNRFMKGMPAYFLGVLCAVIAYKPKKLRLFVNGTALERQITVCAAGNGKMFGGGIKVTPHAEVNDGLLDICIVNRVANIKIPFLLPKMIKGTHETLKITEYFKCEAIEIESEQPYDMQADGEIKYQTPVKITIAKDALKVFGG